jgi:hypothetical protein
MAKDKKVKAKPKGKVAEAKGERKPRVSSASHAIREALGEGTEPEAGPEEVPGP